MHAMRTAVTGAITATTRVRAMVNPLARVDPGVIDRAMEAHLADGRSRTVSVRKADPTDSAVYRTFRTSKPVEGALVWARAYDAIGDLVAQTPSLRVENGVLVVDLIFPLAGVTDWRPTLHGGRIDWNVPAGAVTVEKRVFVDCDPWDATHWVSAEHDWVYHMGADLRLRPRVPVEGTRETDPLVCVSDAFVLVSEGNGQAKGFLLDA